jgi:hypothetical protein
MTAQLADRSWSLFPIHSNLPRMLFVDAGRCPRRRAPRSDSADHLGTILTVSLGLYALGTGIYLISENRRPQATLAWMLGLFFLPGIGLVSPCTDLILAYREAYPGAVDTVEATSHSGEPRLGRAGRQQSPFRPQGRGAPRHPSKT